MASVRTRTSPAPCPPPDRGARERLTWAVGGAWRGNTPGLDLVRLFGAAQFAERDTVMRTIPVLRERQSSEAQGLETKQRHASLVNDGGTVRFVFIQVGEAIRRFGGLHCYQNPPRTPTTDIPSNVTSYR